jgi:hypothetical protein
VPIPDVACWVGAARPSGGKTTAVRLEGFVHMFIFSNVSDAGILITVFTNSFRRRICERFSVKVKNFVHATSDFVISQ